MDKLIYLIPALICPIGMGAMMWLMMRTPREKKPAPDPAAPPTADEHELRQLRSEVEALRRQLPEREPTAPDQR
jgi:hypothetical protein